MNMSPFKITKILKTRHVVLKYATMMKDCMYVSGKGCCGSQSCRSGQTFRIGPGLKFNLQNCFWPMSGMHTKYYRNDGHVRRQ